MNEAIAILGRILRRGLADQPVHFGLADVDPVGLADFGQQQPETNPALGDAAIIVGIAFDLGQRGDTVGLMRRFVTKLGHDVLIFGLNHRYRDREIMLAGELVEQAALHVGAGQPVQFLLLLVAQQGLQLVEIVEAQ